MSRTTKTRSFYLAHPMFDWILPLLVFVVWAAVGWPPIEEDVSGTLYLGTSAAAGIALATAAFVASQLFGSTAKYIEAARQMYGVEIRRNWLSIFVWLLIATVTPLVSIMLSSSIPLLAFGLGLLALSILTSRFLRVIGWFALVTSLAAVSERLGDPIRPTLK